MQSIVVINQRLQDLGEQISAQQTRTNNIEKFMFSDYNARLASAISISNDCIRFSGIGFSVGQTLKDFLVKFSAKYKADRGSFFMEFEILTCFIDGLEDKDIRDVQYHGGRIRMIVFLYIVNFEGGQDYTSAAQDLLRIYQGCFPGHSLDNYDLNWFPKHHRKTLGRIFRKALDELAEAEHNGAAKLTAQSVFTAESPSKKLRAAQEGELEGVQLKK